MYHEHMRNPEEVWITSDSFNKWIIILFKLTNYNNNKEEKL
mgnify:CR=1 FL=1